MDRAFLLSMVSALALAPGCTCAKSGQDGAEGGPTVAHATTAAADGNVATGRPAARFSAPIAATRVGGGAVLVAGLVVPDKTIVVTRLEAGGATDFPVVALRGVTWSSDAELRLFPADGGAAVIWRGLRDGKQVRQMVAVGKAGDVRGEPVEVGAPACATEDGLAWIERGPSGRTRVALRLWGAAASRDVAIIGPDREPFLVCGAHRLYALGQGETDVTLAIGDADAGRVRRLIGAKDFGDDEEREHDEFTVGDDLGVVRLGGGGQIAVREAKGGELGAWRKLTTTIPGDDDVVAVDGDAHALIVVTTREVPGACGKSAPSGVAASVHVLRVDRASFAETSLELASAECAKDLGPFWTGSTASRLVVGWAERVGKRDASTAPISGLAYRTFDGASLTPIVRVAHPADALVDAGCDKDRCYAVALARAPGTTDMIPEVAEVITYP